MDEEELIRAVRGIWASSSSSVTDARSMTDGEKVALQELGRLMNDGGRLINDFFGWTDGQP